jgi:hypothetical protein
MSDTRASCSTYCYSALRSWACERLMSTLDGSAGAGTGISESVSGRENAHSSLAGS